MIETITREQYLKAYKDAPETVRAVYDADLTTQTIVGIKNKFNLHIDSAGILGTEVGYLLLGLTNPGKFASRLKEQNFSDQMIDEIAKEINQKIFVPLREQMEKGPVVASESPKPAMPQPAIQPQPMTVPPAPELPQGVYAPPLQSPRYFHLENKLPITRIQPPAVSRPTPPHPQPPLSSPKATEGAARPAAIAAPGTMPNNRMLEDHEEPHIDIRGTETPLRQALRTVMPRPAVASGVGGPPTNLPGVIPPPVPPRPAPPQVAPVAPSAPVKPYLSDPYREPIE